MKKQLFLASLLASTTLLLPACGDTDEKDPETNKDGTESSTIENSEEVVIEDAEDEVIVFEEEADESLESEMADGEESSEGKTSNELTPDNVTSTSENTGSESNTAESTGTNSENPSPLNEVTETKKEIETPKVIEKLSHESFDALLKAHVSSSGKVNYNGFKNDKSKLEAYCEHLGKHFPKSNWSNDEKLAYWINVYNAFTIKLILDNGIPSSIRDINGGKAWNLKSVKLGKHEFSLDQVENKIIRPTFQDARIHFAVNCAAKSCPKLLNGAFFPSTLDTQLEKATKLFINNSAKNTISSKSVEVSRIFEWYAVDFGNLIEYLNNYSDTPIKSSAKISYKDYDWNLNN